MSMSRKCCIRITSSCTTRPADRKLKTHPKHILLFKFSVLPCRCILFTNYRFAIRSDSSAFGNTKINKKKIVCNNFIQSIHQFSLSKCGIHKWMSARRKQKAISCESIENNVGEALGETILKFVEINYSLIVTRRRWFLWHGWDDFEVKV